MFEPSSPESKEAVAMTLTGIHEQITNVLPAKWVDESDVYEVLEKLNFKPSMQKTITEIEVDNKKVQSVSHSLKYFVKTI